MANILIVANRDKSPAMELADAAGRELEALGCQVAISSDRHEDLSRYAPEKVVVFGGDGTVLGAVGALGSEPPPVLAFNVGRLGYLAENPPENMKELLRLAVENKLPSTRRCMIEGSVFNANRQWRDFALNEFAISYRQNRRQLLLSVKVDGEELMELRGDGLILATPTGSTAYSLSAGGPVANPEMSAMLLTPLCPHQLAIRPLILLPGETVGLSHRDGHAVEVMADGRSCFNLEKGEEMLVRVSQRKVCFLYQPRGRYTLLREKLGWGWDEDRRGRS